MGEPSTPQVESVPQPRQRSLVWWAAVPFALAWSFAAATLNASLAPATVDEPRLEQPVPEPSPPATHHDEMDFDSSELISV
jgi:hypothetical protein